MSGRGTDLLDLLDKKIRWWRRVWWISIISIVVLAFTGPEQLAILFAVILYHAWGRMEGLEYAEKQLMQSLSLARKDLMEKRKLG